MMKRFFLRLLVLCLLGAAFWSCVNLGEGTKNKTRFYVLRPLASEQAVAIGHGRGLGIGVGPVRIPEYLGRPQIVTRLGPNELQVNEFHRWAEPLDENFVRTLGENLSVLLTTDKVYNFPWKTSVPLDYQVLVDVTRFDGVLGGEVTLRVLWTLYDGDGKEILLRKKGEYPRAAADDSYDELVSAHRESLEALSRDIAVAIEEMEKS